MTKIQDKLKTKLGKLPDSPGVYFFMGKSSQILYIGKATSLRSRVKSYFTGDIAEKRSPLIAKMIGEVANIKFEKTDSVLEALILESRLIKSKQPPYNIANKDQKSFNFVVITREPFPRVLVVREREITPPQPLPFARGGARGEVDILYSFGPFPHGRELREALKIIRKIFPFRDKCTPFPPSPSQGEGQGVRSRSCFNYQIGLCPGVCVGAVSEKEYAKTIRHIKTFFEGNKKGLLKNLEREMKEYAKNREFEKADETKRKIFALKHINDVALIKKENSSLQALGSKLQAFRIEAYDIAHLSGTNMVGVMTVIENGEPKKSDYRMFKIKKQTGADDTRALIEVLERRFGHPEWPPPNLIVADGGIAQLNAAKSVVESFKMNIPTVAVTKDQHHKAREILGIEKLKPARHASRGDAGGDLKIERLENQILLANSEAHRFALNFHRKIRGKLP